MRSFFTKTRYPLLLAGGVFFVLLPWIFFDVDRGDQAFNNVSAWLMAFHPANSAEYNNFSAFAPMWFSIYLDSLWWKLIGPMAPLLLARLGWIAWNIAGAISFFFVFRVFFAERKVFPAVLLTVLVVNCAADHFVLSYNSIAPVLGALSFSLFALSYRFSGKGSGFILSALSGFFALFAVHAKLPCMPFICLFFALAFLLEIFLGDSRKFLLLRFVSLFLGIAIGIGVAMLLLRLNHQWEIFSTGALTFLENSAKGSDTRYTKMNVILKALGHYEKIAIGALLFSFTGFILSRWKGRAALTILVVVYAGFVMGKYGVALSILIGATIVIIGLRLVQERGRLPLEKYILILGGVFALVAFTFGTYLEGVQNFKYGLWILFPLGLLELDGVASGRIQPRAIKVFLAAAACILFLVTRMQWPTFPYLERTIFSMSTPFQQPTLRGVYTYPEKQEAVDELARALGRLGVKESDTLLAYTGAGPMYPISFIYSITRTIPLFHNAAMVEYPAARWPTNKRKLLELASAGQLPAVVVRLKKSFPFHLPSAKTLIFRVWRELPETETSGPFEWTTGAANGIPGEMDEILRAAGYKAAWENDYFVALAK